MDVEGRGTKFVLERFDRAFERGRILRWLVLTVISIWKMRKDDFWDKTEY